MTTRRTHVPAGTAALGPRLSALEAQVEGLHGGLERLAASVEALAHDVRRGQAPKYGTIFSGLGVVVTVIAGLIVLGARGPLETLADLKQSQAGEWTRHLEEAREDGARDARIEILSKGLEAYSGESSKGAREAGSVAARLEVIERFLVHAPPSNGKASAGASAGGP